MALARHCGLLTLGIVLPVLMLTGVVDPVLDEWVGCEVALPVRLQSGIVGAVRTERVATRAASTHDVSVTTGSALKG